MFDTMRTGLFPAEYDRPSAHPRPRRSPWRWRMPRSNGDVGGPARRPAVLCSMPQSPRGAIHGRRVARLGSRFPAGSARSSSAWLTMPGTRCPDDGMRLMPWVAIIRQARRAACPRGVTTSLVVALAMRRDGLHELVGRGGVAGEEPRKPRSARLRADLGASHHGSPTMPMRLRSPSMTGTALTPAPTISSAASKTEALT